MDPNTDKLLAELQRVTSTADERCKRRTIDKLRQLQYSLESPEETMQRLMYGGRMTLGFFSLISPVGASLKKLFAPVNFAART